MLETYDVVLLGAGMAVLGAAVVPRLLSDRPLSFPVVYVLAGIIAFALPLGLPAADPVAHPEITTRLAELVVIVSLMGVGLQIDRPLGWQRWSMTWRLLGIAMPASIAGAAVLGWWAGLAPAAALLLGAVVAPTDPVLANDVQVEPPGEGGEDAVRFALTSEAGLNDALAFPFTNAAVAAAGATMLGDWIGEWVVVDVVFKLAVGAGVGLVGGWLLALFIFHWPESSRPARSVDGFVALGGTLAVYGCAELANGYGFLSVFIAACVIRARERGHDYHGVLHQYAENTERLLAALLLVLLGGSVVAGVLAPLGWSGLAATVAIVLVVRPMSGMVALAGARIGRAEMWAISFFGIRGMGSVYYLAYGVTHAEFPGEDRIWAIGAGVVLLSVVVHGLTATPVMRWLDALEPIRR